MRQRQVTLQAAKYRWGREYAWISSCKLACYRSKYLSGKEKKKNTHPQDHTKFPSVKEQSRMTGLMSFWQIHILQPFFCTDSMVLK